MDQISVAVLDDYQQVAEGCAGWDGLEASVTFFHDHLGDLPQRIERLAGFDVIVAMRERTPFGRDLLAELPRLRLLVTTGMRNASIDLAAAAERGITVCGTGASGHATGELAWALIQILARNLVDEITSVRGGDWQVGVGRELRGASLGVLGVGRIGSQIAGMGRAFGMDVMAWSQNLTDERAAEVGARRVSMDELLAASDFVTIHLRLSDRTRGLIGARELGLMKPTAVLINTSRGPIVDEEALLAAVENGTIAGAGLDVFDREPLPAGHPFRSHPRIVATPHIGYVSEEAYAVFYPEAVEDIEAWINGSPIRVLSG